MLVKRLAGMMLAGALAAGCGGTLQSQPYGYGTTGGAYGYASPGDNQFYADLAPYGRWVQHPRYGSVFVPNRSGYEPYRNGRWAYDDQGQFVWVSDEPFGWATEHYGRWIRDDRVGWAWMPGQEWSPGWVAWFEAGNDVGWAPLGPDDRPYEDAYRFVPYDAFGRSDMDRRYVSGREWRGQARPIGRTLDPRWFQNRGVSLQPQHVEVRRLDDARRRQVDQQRQSVDNARRYEDSQQRVEDLQRREAQGQYVAPQDAYERNRAEQQRQLEDQQRAREAQQRAAEEAERQRAAQAGIDDQAAAQQRRAAQEARRVEQEQRRDDQQQRRDEAAGRREDQQERRGGAGANPAADQRDAERAQRDAERQQRDAQRDQRDSQRDQRDAQRDRNSGGAQRPDQQSVASRYARQHAAERDALMRHLADLSAQEMRELEQHGGSPASRQALIQKQQQRQAQRLRELEAKQRAQIDAEMRRYR